MIPLLAVFSSIPATESVARFKEIDNKEQTEKKFK